MIQAYAYTDDRGQYVPAEDVQESEVDGKTVYTYEGEPVNREFGKMGKSLKNIVTRTTCTTITAQTHSASMR